MTPDNENRPKILCLFEGDPFKGTRGGDVYSQHLISHLRKNVDVVTVNWATLGITTRVSGQEYADRLARHLGPLAWRAPVLHDGSAYYWMHETNRFLKREGFGPIVSFLQEWLPAREPSLRVRLHGYRFLLRFLHTVDAHIVVSEWLRRRLMRMGVAGSRIDVAWPGLPDECFLSANTTDQSHHARTGIVTAGAYHPSKGQALLIEAVGRLNANPSSRAPRMDVSMFGDVPADCERYFEHLQRRVTELGLSGQVHLHRSVSQQALWSEFSKAALFCFVAAGEGMPLVVLEAMLHGCIPIVLKGSPAVELLGNGQYGLATAASPRSVAKALVDAQSRRAISPGLHNEVAAATAAIAPRWPVAAEKCAVRLLARMSIGEAPSSASGRNDVNRRYTTAGKDL